MSYQPFCITCQAVRGITKQLTWSFYLCSDCEEEYGRTVEERRQNGNEWLNFLINDEAKKRRRILDIDRTRDGKEEYIDETQDSNGDYVIEFDSVYSYSFDPDMLIEYKIYYSGWMIKSSDGEIIELKDSDWENVFSYSV